MTVKLTPKQQRFIEEYLIDLNATQAAIRAGYSRNSARQIGDENLSKPGIADAVAKAKRERSEATNIDAEWVLKQAVELHQRCMQEIRPVRNPKTREQVYDDNGNALFAFNAAAANRSLEIIGKHVEVAAFKDRLEVSGEQSLAERIRAAKAYSRRADHYKEAETQVAATVGDENV
jgi:phage terminase small subunit